MCDATIRIFNMVIDGKVVKKEHVIRSDRTDTQVKQGSDGMIIVGVVSQ